MSEALNSRGLPRRSGRNGGRPPGSKPLEAFLAEPNERGCIEWRGFRDANGYGVKSFGRRSPRRFAHRVAYEQAHGPIPAGMHVLHRCDNPPCCNPDHLFLGTHADNMADCRRKGRHHLSSRTHCPHGHEYTARNTRIDKRPDGYVQRACRRCGLDRQRARRLKKRRFAPEDRATNRVLTLDGVSMPMKDWAKKLGIAPQSLRLRLKTHPVEIALTAPRRNYPARRRVRARAGQQPKRFSR